MLTTGQLITKPVAVHLLPSDAIMVELLARLESCSKSFCSLFAPLETAFCDQTLIRASQSGLYGFVLLVLSGIACKTLFGAPSPYNAENKP